MHFLFAKMIRNISSTSRRLASGRPNELLFPNRVLHKIRLTPYFPIKNVNFRNISTVNLQEIPTQKAFEEEDAEMATEKEFAELKRALRMTIWQAYNPEHLLLIHPKLRIKREGVAMHTTPQWEVEEAQALCQTIPGYRVVSSIIVGTDKNVRKKLIWKIGRLEAIKEYKQKYNISALMINVDMLSPLQQSELSSYFGVPIYDRFNIVMNIFRLYAKTKEARLQIALAEIPYIRTRLKFMTNRPGMDIQSQTLQLATALTSISSSDGCKNMDILRLREQRIRKQIKAIMETTKQEIVELKAKGGPAKTPVIGIIGYTNSGKTTLIKKLTNSNSLFGENRLFATLDTTTHHATLPSANKVILADTIGFISNLPLKLFASFSATLQHVANADLLIHIMDFSHPNVLAQRDNVFEMLQNLKIQKSLMDNILQVGNKMDKCDSARKEELMRMGLLASQEDEQLEHPILPISCRTTEGMPELIRRMDKAVQIMNGSKIRRLRLAPSSNAIPYLYEHGFVQNVPEPSDCGHFLLFDVVMNDNQFAKFQAALGTRFKRKEEEKEGNLER